MASPGETIEQEAGVVTAAGGGHVLLLPYPSQGHVHRCCSSPSGSRTAACAPCWHHAPHPRHGLGRLQRGRVRRVQEVTAYLALLESAGQRPMASSSAARPRRVLALGARRGAAAWSRWRGLFTQPCAVRVVYGHVWSERVVVPVEAGVTVVGLPRLPVAHDGLFFFFVEMGHDEQGLWG